MATRNMPPRITVRKNSGSVLGTRGAFNFIEGTNVTLTIADDGISGSDEFDVTINATSGGGGGGTGAAGGAFDVDTSSLGAEVVDFWKMDEASPGPYQGERAIGTLEGINTPTTGTGPTGAQCALFASANSEYAKCTDASWLGDDDTDANDVDFYVSLWVKLTTSTADQVFVSHWDTTGDERGWRVYFDNAANRFKFDLSGDGTAGDTDTATADTLGAVSDATWYHIVCYHDSTTDLIGINVDDGGWDTAAHTTGIHSSPADYVIGADAAPGDYADALIADVGIFLGDTPSADQLDDLYNGGSGNTFTRFESGDHASTHLKDGGDEINADELDIDAFSPSTYTPTTTPTGDTAHLAAHLYALDQFLAGVATSDLTITTSASDPTTPGSNLNRVYDLDCSSATIEFQPPDPSGNSGKWLWVKDATGSAATYPITINPVVGNIDGAATIVLNQAWDSAILYCDGAGWATSARIAGDIQRESAIGGPSTFNPTAPNKILEISPTGGDITVELPDPSGRDGEWFWIANSAGTVGTYVITINPAVGNIDGVASIDITRANGSVFVFCNGTGWHTVGYRQATDGAAIYVSKNSAAEVGPRKTLNLIEANANVALTVADDSGGDEVDVTIETKMAAAKNDSSPAGNRQFVNFLDGDNVTIGVADNSGNDSLDVTVTSGITVGVGEDADVGPRKTLHFDPQHNITITVADDAGGDEIDVSVYADMAAAKNNSAADSVRQFINFLDGTSTTVTVADNSGNDSIDVTVSMTNPPGFDVNTSSLETDLRCFWPLTEAVGQAAAAAAFDVNRVAHLYAEAGNIPHWVADGKTGPCNYFTASEGDYFGTNAQEWLAEDTSSTTSFWVSVWVKAATIASAGAKLTIMGHSDDVNSGGLDAWRLYIDDRSGDTAKFTFDVDGSSITSLQASGTVSAATWYHVVAYYDSAEANELGIAVDGGSFATANHGSGVGNPSKDFYIGASYGFTTQDYFDGRICDAGYWVGVKPTTAQRDDLYNGGAGNTYRR